MLFVSSAVLRGRWALLVSLTILWILGLSGYYFRNYRTPTKVIETVRSVSEFYQWNTTSSFNPVKVDVNDTTTAAELCKTFPKHLLESIQTVLKLGHGEPRERVQAQLESVSACLDNLLVFSDVEEEISGRHVIDIIADLPSTYSGDPDLEDYVKQRDWVHQGQAINTSEIHGWKLDKFKFLPQIERAWNMRPNRNWYVFYESDTYIVWDNLFRLLENFDPDHPLYFGSPSPGREKSWFAYGGTGYVLSRAAVASLLARNSSGEGEFIEPSLSQRWQKLVSADCCGDSVLGWALIHAKVNISGFWPMFNPHGEQSVPFSHRYWCQPVISMHKTLPERMVSLWRWEFSARNADKPMLYRDLYQHTAPQSMAVRADWNNADWDDFLPPEGTLAHNSFEDCGRECGNHPDCFQYTYHLTRCTFSRAIRLGHHSPPHKGKADEQGNFPPGDPRFTAGWNVGNIERWVTERPCEEVQWVRPSTRRIY